MASRRGDLAGYGAGVTASAYAAPSTITTGRPTPVNRHRWLDPARHIGRLRKLRKVLANRWAYAVGHRIEGLHRIRGLAPLRYPTAAFSVHMVTCHRDLDMALWALRSFTYFAEVSPPIFVHDDGSLTEQDKAALRNGLARCTVIDRADADQAVDRWLAAYPHSRQMRKAPSFYCALKLFDPWVYTTNDVVVLIDSDVLFFGAPDELLACAAAGTACFNSDYQNAYALGPADLERHFGMTLLDRVNAGLLVLGRRDYDLDLIERYFASVPLQIPNLNKHEQTVYAALLSRAGARRLSEAYQISSQTITAATVSHHFVDDGARSKFGAKGVRTLRRRGFLDRLAALQTARAAES